MSEIQIKTKTIRDYLLGRISDEMILEEIEDLLFSNDEFCDQIELTEDSLINDYSFGRLEGQDLTDFEKSLENNLERKSKIQFTQSLKEKANPKTHEEKVSLLDSIKAFLIQPLYAASLGVLFIAVLAGIFYLLLPNNNDELAELKNIYKNERPITSRISGFEHAPYVAERSETGDEANNNKLRLIENKLLETVENKPNAASFHALGVFYLTQKKFAEAIKNLQKAVELDNINPNYRNDLGTAYFEFAKNGEKSRRLESLARANEEFTKTYEQNLGFLSALFNRSLVLQELNLQKQAEDSWNIYLKKDSKSKWADEARKKLEQLKQKENSFKTKEQVLNEFLTAYRKKDEKKLWQIHNETKGLFNGVSLHQQLTRGYLESHKRKDEHSANEYLEALKHIGKLEKEKHADFFFAETSEYYSTIEEKQLDGLNKAKDLLSNGIDLVMNGKYSDSIKKFEESKAVFLKAGNQVESNIAELLAAEMLPDVGKIEESRKRLTAIISNAENKNYKVILPTAFYWLGVGNSRQKNFSIGIKFNKKGLLVAEKTSNIFEIKHSSESISQIYTLLGELDKSLIYLSKATSGADDFYLNKAQRWRNLMTVSRLLEDNDLSLTAIDFANECVVISKRYLSQTQAVNNSLRVLIENLSKSRKFERAIKFASEARNIALEKERTPENFKIIADSLLQVASVKRKMGNCYGALEDFEKSLGFYEKTPEITIDIYEVRKGRLLCFKKLNREKDFQYELKTVLKISEEYRRNIREDSTRQAFFESEQIVFDTAIYDAIIRNEKSEAFGLLEKSKARSLLDFVKSDKSIAEIEKDFSAISKPLSIDEIQTRMPKNVQIVQYSLLEDKLAIWVLENDNFELFEKKINLSELENDISRYRKKLLKKENVDDLAKELFQTLIPNNLDKEKILCLILDKSLNQIPFASLISSNNRYLIEDFALFYSPSSSVLALASENARLKENQTEEKLLSIGNPQFNREENPNLADLPNATIEAETIVKNYKDSKKFVNDYATKENFLNNFEDADIIHFAGHFIANGRASTNSKLVFADNNLRSFELSEKKINKAKLVVLSACETAFEKINKSEGAIGIGRTFLAMGTPIVIASNWKVDSEATKDLMISFHQKRKTQGLSTIESLRQSQLELLKSEKTMPPYYWSAFSAIGGFTRY